MASKKTRELKVCGTSGYNYQTVPSIMLKGKWLKEAGFELGDFIKVQCEDGKLIISVDEDRKMLVEAQKAFLEEERKKVLKQFEKDKEHILEQYVAEQKIKYGK